MTPRTRIFSTVIPALLLAAIAAVLIISPIRQNGEMNEAEARGAPETFAPMVEKLMPAVVNISTTQKVKAPAMGPGGLPFQLPDDPQFEPFREFFEQYNQRGGQGGGLPSPDQEVYSLGSGFIIDPTGFVVTNNHVIADAEEISVILPDDTKLLAKIVGRDEKTDLALLKVETKQRLPFVRFGNSDEARVGDWVLAIGNPFGLGGTVTAGIISARSRSINAGPFDDFLQTDAAINRGNSGGPMFNTNGEVIGINTAIFSPSGGNIGIGFATPSALAMPVIMQLKEFGRTYRGWLGVKIQHVTDEIAESVGLKDSRGALVLEVTPDSPASKADILPGDIIVSFDDKPIDEMRKLPRLVAETKVGKAVELELWRDGKRRETQVTLGELDEGSEEQQTKAESKKEPTADKVQSETVMGIELAQLTPELRNRFGFDEKTGGLVVLDIERGSAAAEQGLRPGDLILQVNDRKISTAKELTDTLAAVAKAGRNNALVRIRRGEEWLFITLPTQPAKEK